MRLKTRAEKQAERAAATPPRYNRKFARSQWRRRETNHSFKFSQLLEQMTKSK